MSNFTKNTKVDPNGRGDYESKLLGYGVRTKGEVGYQYRNNIDFIAAETGGSRCDFVPALFEWIVQDPTYLAKFVEAFKKEFDTEGRADQIEFHTEQLRLLGVEV